MAMPQYLRVRLLLRSRVPLLLSQHYGGAIHRDFQFSVIKEC